MDVVEVLQGAKEALLTRGWFQGNYEGPDGRVCLLGACRVAAGVPLLDIGMAPRMEDGQYLDYAMTKALRGERNDVPEWNDDPDRTFNEVIDLIDATVIRLKDERA